MILKPPHRHWMMKQPRRALHFAPILALCFLLFIVVETRVISGPDPSLISGVSWSLLMQLVCSLSSSLFGLCCPGLFISGSFRLSVSIRSWGKTAFSCNYFHLVEYSTLKGYQGGTLAHEIALLRELPPLGNMSSCVWVGEKWIDIRVWLAFSPSFWHYGICIEADFN